MHLTVVAWFVACRNPDPTDGSRLPSRPEDLDTAMPPSAAASAPASPKPFHHAAAAVLHTAERLYAMEPEWVVFFREVLGVDGIVSRTFGSGDARMRFECSPQYARIREMLDSLRARDRDRPADREAHRVVTVRMPRSLHEALKAEAADRRLSINALCIAKLLQPLDGDAVAIRADAAEPTPAPKRAVRRPR